MQWHPFFAHVLRPLLQEYYDVQTDVPVGDLPREADIVLLRRTAPAPFVGIWRHLTQWNILEFKGPTDTPALRDLDLLLEVGLGIDRRLNDQQRQQGQAIVDRNEVSWWYLANHLGARFRTETENLLGRVEEHGAGLWRATAFGHPFWIVSRDALPVERESVPLHLVTLEPVEQSRALVAEMVRQRDLWHTYGVALLKLHTSAWQEVVQMEPSLLEQEPFTGDLRPLIAVMGLQRIIDQVGLDKIVDLAGVDKVVDQVGGTKFVDRVGVDKLVDLVGVDKIVDQVGVEKFVDRVSADKIVDQKGAEKFVEELSPDQVQKLKEILGLNG